MSFVGFKKTSWEPGDQGDIVQMRREDPGWRTVLVWRSTFEGLEPHQLKEVCRLMNIAYGVGREEQAEDTRAILGIKQR